MKKFYVRKIFEYDPTFGGKYSRYEGYRSITLKKSDPGIIVKRQNILPLEIVKIFHSTQKRATETALVFSKVCQVNDLIALKELEEVRFDLGELVDEKEFNNYGSNLVRERFIDAFIKEDSIEKRTDIKKRLECLLEKFNEAEEGNYLLISHSFTMKILQVYLAEASLFGSPEILKIYFNPLKKTFEFGSGFEFNL